MSSPGTEPVPLPLSPRAAAFAEAVNRGVVWFARHWLAVFVGWGLLVIGLACAAPLLRAEGHSRLATVIYLPFRLICHQRDDRSFHLQSAQLAFCQRDLAIVAGAVIVGLLYGLIRRFHRAGYLRFRWAALAALPMAVDGVSQLLGLRESVWELRVVTGLLFSAGIGWFALPHLEGGFAAVRDGAAGQGSDATAAGA